MHACMYMCVCVRMCEYINEFLCISRPISLFILFLKYFGIMFFIIFAIITFV